MILWQEIVFKVFKGRIHCEERDLDSVLYNKLKRAEISMCIDNISL